MQCLQLPTPQLALVYVQRFDTDQAVVEMALAKLFGTFPNNTSADEVLLKVVALNSLYATNIYATREVADNIFRLDIDRKLEQHSLELVNEIALVTIKGKTRRNYSFASKYCAWHSPETYPIYDSYVDGLLWAYQKKHKFSNFNRYDLWNSYPQYVKAVRDFQERFGLQQFTLKQVDNFLWLYGKECAAQ